MDMVSRKAPCAQSSHGSGKMYSSETGAGEVVVSLAATQVFRVLPAILIQSHPAFSRHFLPRMEGQMDTAAASGTAATQDLYFFPAAFAQSHAAFFRHFLAFENEAQTGAGAAVGAAVGAVLTATGGLVHVLNAALLTRVKTHPAFTHLLAFLPNEAHFCPLISTTGTEGAVAATTFSFWHDLYLSVPVFIHEHPATLSHFLCLERMPHSG